MLALFVVGFAWFFTVALDPSEWARPGGNPVKLLFGWMPSWLRIATFGLLCGFSIYFAAKRLYGSLARRPVMALAADGLTLSDGVLSGHLTWPQVLGLRLEKKLLRIVPDLGVPSVQRWQRRTRFDFAPPFACSRKGTTLDPAALTAALERLGQRHLLQGAE